MQLYCPVCGKELIKLEEVRWDRGAMSAGERTAHTDCETCNRTVGFRDRSTRDTDGSVRLGVIEVIFTFEGKEK